MLDSKDYKISRLIAKKFSDGLPPEEEERLKQWLAASSDNQRLYDRIIDPANKALRDSYVEDLDVNKEWREVEKHLRVAKKRSRRLGRGMGIAASIAILIGVGVWFMQIPKRDVFVPSEFVGIQVGSSKAIMITSTGEQIQLQDSNVHKIVLNDGVVALNDGKSVSLQGGEVDTVVQEVWYCTIKIPRGGEYNLTLSDNTRVYLNSDSEVRFPKRFVEDKREVFLTGEAFFIVNTPSELQVEILGTEFNVQAYADKEDIEATLKEGSVRIVSGDRSLKLRPNEQAVYNRKNGSLTSCEVDADVYSAWREGRFVIKNETLESIMTRLSRWYNIEVVYIDPEVKNYHFSGKLECYEDFTEALQML